MRQELARDEGLGCLKCAGIDIIPISVVNFNKLSALFTQKFNFTSGH